MIVSFCRFLTLVLDQQGLGLDKPGPHAQESPGNFCLQGQGHAGT